MKCQDYQKWISDRLDGNLSQKKQLKLEEHLRACPICRRYYEDLKMIEDRVRQLPGAELPDPAVFEDKLRERISLKGQEIKKEQKRSLITRLVPAGAVGLLVLAAVVYLFLRMKPAVEPEADLALLMSYEESYLTLSQALSTDEKWQNEYSDDILDSIYEEVRPGELFDEGSFNIFQEQNNNNNIEDILLIENMEFWEGK